MFCGLGPLGRCFEPLGNRVAGLSKKPSFFVAGSGYLASGWPGQNPRDRVLLLRSRDLGRGSARRTPPTRDPIPSLTMSRSKPGLFRRLRNAISSQLNSAVDAVSDPGREVALMLDDLAAQIKVAETNLRQAIVDRKVLERKRDDILAEEKSWEQKAEQALKLGDESLARAALERKSVKAQERLTVQTSLQEQDTIAETMRADIERSKTRLKELNMRRGTLMAQARANKQMEQGGTVESSMTGLADIEAKIDAMEAENEAMQELSADKQKEAEVSRKFEQITEKTELDNELEALKRKLAGDRALPKGSEPSPE